MRKVHSDTIIAPSTPPGHSAIAVLRISGSQAIEWVNQCFPGKDLSRVKTHTVHFGKITDDSEKVLDECLVTVFKAPHSYTCEDTVEISCHGSPYIVREMIDLFSRKGARPAERGEFTLRAFLNGRLDLSQAEAVADLIQADSATSHEMALRQMKGSFSDLIRQLRQELIDFAALIELELDFSEEDIEFADRKRLEDLVKKIVRVVTDLMESFRLGNVMKNGIATVIAGRPNAGKSTLLNALLNEDRAIVSEVAGTTRDTIEEILNIKGLQFRLIDTAGIRDALDSIEKIGVEKTMEKISKASLVIYLFDVITTSPEQLWEDVERFLHGNAVLNSGCKIVFVANKMDLNPYTQPGTYYRNGLIGRDNLITASALHQMNIEALKDVLYNTIVEDPKLLDTTLVTNSRHYEALFKTRQSLESVLEGLSGGISGDILSLDIRQALYHLGTITGQVSNEDLLDSIFSRFCIGK